MDTKEKHVCEDCGKEFLGKPKRCDCGSFMIHRHLLKRKAEDLIEKENSPTSDYFFSTPKSRRVVLALMKGR